MPKVKAHPLTFQDDINTHNFNLESNLIDSMASSRDMFHPLSSHSHNPLPLYFIDQSLSNSFDSQFANSSSDQVQGSHISQVEEKKGEYSFYLSSLFRIPLCQDGVPSFLVDLEPINLGIKSNDINFPNQSSKVLGNHHFDDADSIDVYDEGCPSAPTGLSISQEHFYLKYLGL